MNDSPRETTPAIQPASRFAAIRDHCRQLLLLKACERAAALDILRESDAQLGAEVAELLAHVDDADLQPPLERPKLAPNSMVGPFRLRALIGKGGMGDVFLADRIGAGFEQQVAVKCINALVISDELTRRFVQERQLLARLQHDGIAGLIDGGLDGEGRPWLAMEYIEGLSLLDFANAHALDLPARLGLLREVCTAVDYAHRNLVVHRDLKPGNILVTPDGRCKLLDFGIAKLLHPGELDVGTEATRFGTRALTLRYAAPEQWSGERTTTATDVHALGVILFELAWPTLDTTNSTQTTEPALGRVPGDALPRMSAQQRSEKFLAWTPWRRTRLNSLDAIIQKATARRPVDRYASVSQLDADLEDWLLERPLRSGLDGAGAASRYLLRQMRWPLALIGSVLVALGIGLYFAAEKAREASAQAHIAATHLDALLDVLGSANPKKFAGRDPPASEFLVAAAQRLQSHYASDTGLNLRALTEIGHGLLNLGQHREAERVLLQALAAADRLPSSNIQERLSVLALLVQSQDAPEAVARLPASVTRIEAMALLPEAPASSLIDALARAAGPLSRYGATDEAERVLDQAEQILQRTPQLDGAVTEHFWRQRGWVNLRSARFSDADRAFALAEAQYLLHPQEFGTLRRAESDFLRAETALELGDTGRARLWIARAQVEFFKEYAADHPERAAFNLLRARWLLAVHQSAAASQLLSELSPVLAAHLEDYAREQAIASLLIAQAQAELGQCGPSAEARRSAEAFFVARTFVTPRDMAERMRTQMMEQAACSTGTASG